MTAVATINYEGSSVTLNNTVDSDGDRFILGDMEGLGSPPVDVKTVDRYSDGSWLSTARYGKRELNLHGLAVGKRYEDGSVFRAKQKVENWFADFGWNERWLYLQLVGGGTPIQLKVIPGGELHFGTPKANMIEFEVPFTALDPRKYSQFNNQPNVSSTSAVLTNSGNYPTFIYAYLLSGATNPFVEINGQRLALSGSMPAGVEVDFLNRTTIHPSNGIRDLAAVPRSWPALLPGNNAVTTSGNWRLDYRAAYR
jgi:hypothetical protein